MTDQHHLIGYEALQNFYEVMKKSTPKGIGLKKDTKGGKHYILLQFTIGEKRTAKPCNCTFTEDGIRNAVLKAQKVAESLTKFSTESEFMAWYDSEILEKNVIKNDLITFGEAIKRVEDDFWKKPDRRSKEPRDRNNPSHQASWLATYVMYYKWLPADKVMNPTDILAVINRYKEGDKSYGDCVSVMRKLCRLAGNNICLEALKDLSTSQTKYKKLQSIDIDAFLKDRDKVLGITEELYVFVGIERKMRENSVQLNW